MKDRKSDREEIIAELRRIDLTVNIDSVKISRLDVEMLVEKAKALFFPVAFLDTASLDFGRTFEELSSLLKKILSNISSGLSNKTEEIIGQLPKIKKTLIKDALAIYNSDPAAASLSEVIICYPGLFADMIYRIAHLLYLYDVPYLPRVLSEYAHERTGIDIHPGAKIGESFCIDHGTGVVIGETAELGEGVKIYQGVTIGAKSISPDPSGNLRRGNKRHPTIGNGCVIYAGATILGGDTIIGDHCVIGGNVWLTHSIPQNTTVYYNKKGDCFKHS